MWVYRFVVVFSVGLGGAALAADSTAPLSLGDRNDDFQARASVQPTKKSPSINEAIQEKRVDKSLLEKKPAAMGDRRAAIDVSETHEKQIREKDTRRPTVIERVLSRFNHREASISTSGSTREPVLVGKYQDSLKSASAANMARFPALAGATNATINRFVFRKNAAEPGSVTEGASVTPAGGGPAGPK